MKKEDKIHKLEEFKSSAIEWQRIGNSSRRAKLRTFLNQNKVWARREVVEAGCFHTITISPPPAIGGLIMRNVDPIQMMFDPPWNMNMIRIVTDMIDQAIGVLSATAAEVDEERTSVKVEADIKEGYAFIAMPIDPDAPQLDDVLDAIKEGCKRCGIHAERVDEPEYNERITDRILESVRRAEYVIVDLTNSKPNVFYEAGYAQGLGKTPIYIARQGTQLEFDLKDYPVIFFENLKQLKDSLERRLRGLAESKKQT